MENNFMLEAIKQSKLAYRNGDVPVGAIIVKNNEIISKAYNKREKNQNALYHAEILAINKACKKLNSFRLDDCDMYVTLEPCPMCSGAIVNARIKNLYYGASDEHYGCAGSIYNIVQDKKFEHVVMVQKDIMADKCKEVLLDFFSKVRKKNKVKKLIGTNISVETKAFDFDNENIEVVTQGKVIATIEDCKKMEVLPVISNIVEECSAQEIYKKCSKYISNRIKIVTITNEKKYFN